MLEVEACIVLRASARDILTDALRYLLSEV